VRSRVVDYDGEASHVVRSSPCKHTWSLETWAEALVGQLTARRVIGPKVLDIGLSFRVWAV
jgi:hypothetical protein